MKQFRRRSSNNTIKPQTIKFDLITNPSNKTKTKVKLFQEQIESESSCKSDCQFHFQIYDIVPNNTMHRILEYLQENQIQAIAIMQFNTSPFLSIHKYLKESTNPHV
ncbi:MAG: hypothetical protein LBF70_01135 [Holosporales bacterium]|nr:hypothetical protein [Holosporales bacterium]